MIARTSLTDRGPRDGRLLELVDHVRFFTLSSATELIEGAGLRLVDVTVNLNPRLDQGQVKATGNCVSHGRLAISDLSRDEVLRFFAYQYIVIAQRPPSS